MGGLTRTRNPVPGDLYDAAVGYAAGGPDPGEGVRVVISVAVLERGEASSPTRPLEDCRRLLDLAALHGVARGVAG